MSVHVARWGMDADHVAVLLPGFTRQPEDLAVFAEVCRETGWRVISPSLAPRALPFLYMLPTRLRRIASSIAKDSGELPIVLVGHSAGASAACFLAKELVTAGCHVRGVVLVDGVDSPNHLIRRYLPSVRGVRVAAVFAPPSPCNRNGMLAQDITAYPWVRSELVPGAGHGDFEGDGIGIYRRMCKDTSTPQVAQDFRATVLASMEWALEGDKQTSAG